MAEIDFLGGLGLLLNSIVWYRNSVDYYKTTFDVIRQAVFYPKGAMWFVLALIIMSYIHEFFIREKVSQIIMWIIAFGLFCFALFCNTYFFVIEGTSFEKIVIQYLDFCYSARNGLFLYVYMLIGYTMSSDRVMRVRKGALIIIVLLAYGLMVGEAVWLNGSSMKDDASLLLSHIILLPAFVLLLTKIDVPVSHHAELRRISSVMYYTHPVVHFLLSFFAVRNGIMMFVVVCLASVMVYIVTESSKNKCVKAILY